MAQSPLNLYISYARENAQMRDRVLENLAPLKFSGQVRIWWDGEIKPGDLWQKKLTEEAQKADIVLCLVSNAFLASDFIQKTEIPLFQKRSIDDPNFQLHFLLMEDTLYQRVKYITERQILNPDGKPLNQIRPQAQAYTKVVNRLWIKIETHPNCLSQSWPNFSDPKPKQRQDTKYNFSKESLLQQLPGGNDRLVGRERELEKLEEFRNRGGVLAWVGFGGVGKSALLP
jgi:hypothetical protein